MIDDVGNDDYDFNVDNEGDIQSKGAQDPGLRLSKVCAKWS